MPFLLCPAAAILAAALAAPVPAQAQASSQSGTSSPAAPESKVAPLTLGEFSATLENLVNRVRPSVVQIYSTGYATAEDSDSSSATSLLTKQHSTGSGIILTADGYILTNAHVVRDARRIQVRLPSRTEATGRFATMLPEGKLIDAKLIGRDRDIDLAVVKIDKTGLPALQLGDSNRIHQGQLVMAFGSPLGLESSVSMGVVSSTARALHPDDLMMYIQTDAPINPGNSGGPLVDAEGRVIGINTFILTQSGGSEGLGFAIPSNIARNVFGQIKREGHVHRRDAVRVGERVRDGGELRVPDEGQAEHAGEEEHEHHALEPAWVVDGEGRGGEHHRAHDEQRAREAARGHEEHEVAGDADHEPELAHHLVVGAGA